MQDDEDTERKEISEISTGQKPDKDMAGVEAYLTSEMAELRQEIRFLIDLVVKTENVVLLVIGACISFHFSISGNDALKVYTSVFPLVVTLMGLWRFISLRKSIGRIDGYLLKVEGQILGSEFGWVRFHHSDIKSNELRSGFLPWIVMGFVSAVFFAQTSPSVEDYFGTDDTTSAVHGEERP